MLSYYSYSYSYHHHHSPVKISSNCFNSVPVYVFYYNRQRILQAAQYNYYITRSIINTIDTGIWYWVLWFITTIDTLP